MSGEREAVAALNAAADVLETDGDVAFNVILGGPSYVAYWLRERSATLAATAPAHDEAARGLKFRVEVACDGYAALTAADVPDDEFMDFDSYIAGAKAAADAIRAALAPTAAEQVHAARAVADRDAARIAGQVRASGEGREG